jgi:MFS family permease
VTSAGTAPSVRQTARSLPPSVWALLVGTFVNKLGNFLQVFLVLYLVHRGWSAQAAGVALGAYGIGSIAGVLLGGTVTDRFGYRMTIAGSMAAAGALTASLLYVPALWQVLLVALAIGAAAQAYRPAAAALLVELTPTEQHVMVFAFYRLAFNLGMTGGPLIGLLLVRRSYELLFWSDALTSVAFGLVALALLAPHRAPVGGTAPGGRTGAGAAGAAPRRADGYRQVFADLRYLSFLAALLLNALVYIQYLSVLPLHVRDLDGSTTVYGLLVSLNAFLVICCEVPLTRFVQRLPARVAVALGIGLVGLGLNLYALPAGVGGLVLATLVWSVGEMVGTPTASAYPGQVAPPRLRGRYLAAAAVPQQLGYALGPMLGTAAWALWGTGVWWLCGLLSAVAVLAALAGVRNAPAEPAPEPEPEPAAAPAPVAADVSGSPGAPR